MYHKDNAQASTRKAELVSIHFFHRKMNSHGFLPDTDFSRFLPFSQFPHGSLFLPRKWFWIIGFATPTQHHADATPKLGNQVRILVPSLYVVILQ
jgi:hypothetical protein